VAEDAAKRLIEIGSRFEPKLRGALTEAFAALRGSVPEAAVEEAILRGGVGGVMRLLDGANGAFGGVRDRLEEAALAGGRAWIAAVPAGAVLDPAFRFSIVNPDTAAFVRDYSLNLIRAVTEDTREAVRRGLQADVASGLNPRDTARAFRGNLGLTPKQEQAVRNYERALLQADPGALRRKLRDKRSDAAVRRSAKAYRPLPRAQIDRLVERYRQRLLKYRSEVIARTESLRAATVGQRAAVRQAAAQNAVDTARLRRFWVKTNDARTRDAHRRVPEMNPDGVGMDEPYKTPLGPLMYPRDPNGSGANTVQCRCAERYALADAPAPAAGMRARRKPAPKPKAEPKPEPAAPKTPAELRAEYERTRAEAESGKFRGRELTLRQEAASEARVAWARSLPPDELRAAKAEVFREMVRAPKSVDVSTGAFGLRFRKASGWVPFDVLEDMRRKGYTVNVNNRLALTSKNKGGFRAHAKNKHSYLAKDDTGTVFAHEYGHQIDAFFSGGRIDRGSWTNRDFVPAKAKAGYKRIFERLRGDTRGTYGNGDGEFWRDNWLHDYEGRIYNHGEGLEFWAMNCQRYADYRHALAEGFDYELAELRAAAKRVRSLPAPLKKVEAQIRGLESEGREAYAARMSEWGSVKKRYPEMAELMEGMFGGDFARGA
jgi:hypothetical protein